LSPLFGLISFARHSLYGAEITGKSLVLRGFLLAKGFSLVLKYRSFVGGNGL
jgi:hypothetical protein